MISSSAATPPVTTVTAVMIETTDSEEGSGSVHTNMKERSGSEVKDAFMLCMFKCLNKLSKDGFMY